MTLTVAQAQQQIDDAARPLCTTVAVPLHDALARVSATDIVSTIAVPPDDNSAMDGFAVCAADVADTPCQLAVSQRIPAGTQPSPLSPNSAARIFTGGVIPPGADAVVIQEHCEFSNDERVTIRHAAQRGDNIRPLGQDIAQGATVIPQGKKISAVELGLIASIGEQQVVVFKPLRVAIFSTGDELVEPGQTLAAGQIYNSNRTALAALCRQLGYQVIDCGIVEDTLPATQAALQRAASEADVIISSGGVSVGEEDHVRPAVEKLGSLDLWKVQMKPGKPVAFGRVEQTPFLGLPGNPVSSIIVFQLLAQPLLAGLQGERWQPPKAYPVIAGFDKSLVSREEYIRVRVEMDEAGELTARRFDNLSSGVMSSLSWADGLVRQRIDQSIAAGDALEFLPMQGGLL